ncbi:unnamed protein product [Paramecium primaurelia]|uniref:Uncharacterized protein n=1 Tax=Paramecium primaurelia TaxID=5886 RepID=A0A8S1P7C4_PARPR|nr:unnamed protein product [Paramecium primaurelia]
MEEIDKHIYDYNFHQLRLLMQYPSKQNYMYQFIQSNPNWFLNIQFEQINFLYFQQWLTNFITANQVNAQFILLHFQIQPYKLTLLNSQDLKIHKAYLIFIHNMTKNQIDKQYFLFQSFFTDLNIQIIRKSLTTQTQECLEWVTYSFVNIFHETYQQSYLQLLYDNNIELLDFIFQLLQKTIDDKVYPSLIHNYIPKSYDIKELYSNQNKIGIQLSVPDLQFIMNSDFPLIQKFKFYSLITFMGGYNSEIQALFYPKEFREALYQLSKQQEDELISIFLRFIANMVHINKTVWEELKNNLNSLKPIIHFTNVHNIHQQREWATLIIRNLCDCDELRDFLQNYK